MIRALVVDDDVIVCEKHRKVLEDLGCDVVVINSADKALKLLHKDSNFQAIFSDYSMPGKNGFQFAEKAFEINSTIKFFLVTQYGESLRTDSQYQPVDDFLEKPLTEVDAQDTLQRHRLLSSSPRP